MFYLLRNQDDKHQTFLALRVHKENSEMHYKTNDQKLGALSSRHKKTVKI